MLSIALVFVGILSAFGLSLADVVEERQEPCSGMDSSQFYAIADDMHYQAKKYLSHPLKTLW